MKRFQRWLPATLLNQFYLLFLACWLTFFVFGLFIFYPWVFSRDLGEKMEMAKTVLLVTRQDVAENALKGDYPQIQDMLNAMVQYPHFLTVQFTGPDGRTLSATQSIRTPPVAPQWLIALYQANIEDVSQKLDFQSQGVGVMRLRFNTPSIVNDLWSLFVTVLVFALGFSVFGALVLRIPLKRALLRLRTANDASMVNLEKSRLDELQMHKNALAALQKIADSVPLGHSNFTQAMPLALRHELDAITAWVIALVNAREKGRRDLENQKFALDQHAIVLVCDVNSIVTYANDRFCATSGYEKSELIGLVQPVFTRGGGTQERLGQMLLAISKGRFWQGEISSQTKLGETFWLNATVVPLDSENFSTEQFLLIGTDVTASKLQGEKLAEQLNWLEVLLETVPTPIYFKDTSGRYVLVNRAFETLFGLERVDIIGKTVFETLPPVLAQAMAGKDAALQREGGLQTFEEQFTHAKTGILSELRYTRSLTRTDRGAITGVVGVISDETERNMTHRQLHKSRQLAEAASLAKSNFLANMSHEIRTPMNGVMGMTDLALELASDTTQHHYLSIAKSAAKTLMNVIDNILDVSKIESGRIEFEAVDFSLADVFKLSLIPLQTVASKKGLKLELQLEPNLPAHAIGDPVLLRQVLTKLCENAVKFTPSGAVIVRAGLRPLKAHAFELHVLVADTGIGIEEQQQSAVFDIFSQVDTSSTRQYGGTGLGLPICAAFVAMMGGRIELESQLGQGSTFSFAVPLSSVNASPAPLLLELPVPQAPVALQVMLVEDNLVNQILCATILKNIGHTLVIANNGHEASTLFPLQKWDVILMDMHMPVMGGLEATRHIRSLEAPGEHTPIIAMTANAMDTDRQACLEAGMDDYLSKPFRLAELHAILENAVYGQGAI